MTVSFEKPNPGLNPWAKFCCLFGAESETRRLVEAVGLASEAALHES